MSEENKPLYSHKVTANAKYPVAATIEITVSPVHPEWIGASIMVSREDWLFIGIEMGWLKLDKRDLEFLLNSCEGFGKPVRD